MMDEAVLQIPLSVAFYLIVVGLFRFAGKRFAGQTTSFDLLVLISLAVATQQATLQKGVVNALVFVMTVFICHFALARACFRNRALRYLLRGRPIELIKDGQINYRALSAENMCVDELLAGLRKLGIDDPHQVRSAHLEETGQISAIRETTS